MRIPEHIVDDIKSLADIVDTVGRSVRLKRAGRSFKGLCPFHTEKTPSFVVNPDSNTFKCFGCGKSGDSITFLMEHDNMTFPDAVRELAQRLGIHIPEEEYDADTERREGAMRAAVAARDFFLNHLSLPGGEQARTFLAERGVEESMLSAFEIGFAPDDFHLLNKTLLGMGFSVANMVDAGLIVMRDDGNYYDRFRNRVVFTIHDAMGRVRGFSARILPNANDKQGKYINSPQCLIFDKGRLLYGLSQSRKSIGSQKECLLVEGQMDVIAMHQHGFTNTIALSGTALTTEQVSLLQRYCKSVILLLDADAAGARASSRAVELLLSANLDVRLATLPAGEDPDSVLKSQGQPAIRRCLSEADDFITWHGRRYFESGEFSTATRRADSIRQLLTWIAAIPDPLKHSFLIQDLASQFSLNHNLLTTELQKILLQAPGTSARSEPVPQTTQRTPHPAVRAPVPVKQLLQCEHEIIRCLLLDDAGPHRIFEEFGLVEQDLVTQLARRLFRIISHAVEHHTEFAKAVLMDESLSVDDRQIVASMLTGSRNVSKNWLELDIEVPALDWQRLMLDAVAHLHLIRLLALRHGFLDVVMDTADTLEQARILARVRDVNNGILEIRQKIETGTIDLPWLLTVLRSESFCSA